MMFYHQQDASYITNITFLALLCSNGVLCDYTQQLILSYCYFDDSTLYEQNDLPWAVEM